MGDPISAKFCRGCGMHKAHCLCRARQVAADCGELDLEARIEELEIACAQAVEFAQYVVDAAKGRMVERAEFYLSLPYSQELAARIKPRTA